MASSTVKRQRKRKRVDTDGDPEFQVAPMVDVLLVLMLFFMAITSTEILKKEKKLELANANHAKLEHDHRNEIIVNVGWDNTTSEPQFSIDGISYKTAGDMQGVLAAQHQKNPAAHVVIRADKDVEYSNIADVMTTCGDAGITTVSFAVLIGGGNGKAPAASPGGTASN